MSTWTWHGWWPLMWSAIYCQLAASMDLQLLATQDESLPCTTSSKQSSYVCKTEVSIDDLQVKELQAKVDEGPGLPSAPQDSGSIALPEVASEFPQSRNLVCCNHKWAFPLIEWFSSRKIEPGRRVRRHVDKRQFNSWGGKRTFNSWGGKRQGQPLEAVEVGLHHDDVLLRKWLHTKHLWLGCGGHEECAQR